MPEQICVIVPLDPAQGVTITTKGFRGRQCQDATRKLEAALGQVTGETLTDEFYRQAQQDQSQEQEI